MPDVALQVVADPAAVVAELLAEAARAGGNVILTGGKTPKQAYERAAELEPDWSSVHVWWGDERCVPPDDDDSNFKLARESLLDRLGRQPTVHRIEGELAPDDAAERYDRELEAVTLDLLLLGIGPDGHCASLFPGSPQLEVRDRRVTSGPAGLDPYVERVTMTLPLLCSSPRIVFLVAGEDKAEAVGRAFGGEPAPAVPSSLVRSRDGETTLVCDRAAAAFLDTDRP